MNALNEIDPRIFLALLNACHRRNFLQDNSLTEEYIQENVTGQNFSLEETRTLLQQITKFLIAVSKKNLDVADLELLLRERSGFSEAQQEVFIRFWKQQKYTINEFLLNKSKWNDSLQKFRWRLDVKTKAKSLEGSLNEPTAIIELTLGKSGTKSDDRGSEVVRFEMNREKVDLVLKNIEMIEAKLESVSHYN